MQAAPSVLEHFGVDATRVARASAALRPAAALPAEQLTDLLASAADPAMALAGWETLLEVTSDISAVATLTREEWAALFIVLGASQPLTTTLQAAAAGWIDLFRRCYAAPRCTPLDHAAQLRPTVGESWERFSASLRQLRHHQYLRIGLADLTGRYDVETTMRELSALAAGLLAAACQWAERALCEQYGGLDAPPPTEEPSSGSGTSPGGGTRDSFVVLAMGKLGGGELNFSSDIDLMYLYDSPGRETVGGPRGRLDAREYYTRLAELLTRALQEMTAAGFAFRVDLRLRPEGINGPIVNALREALLYYESYGQTWERTALIQARPVAGTLQLGERFLDEVRPFVYRRYLDYTTVADMKEMKARVEAQLGEKLGRGNVKLGRGGIREIEFVVQVLQLVHGGRDERVRGGGSLATLPRLTAAGYLPGEEGEALARAYRFLRNVEHKIQIVHQRQTHTIPAAAREQETLARRLAYGGDDPVAQLWADLEAHTGRVRRAFEKLFYEPAAETRRTGDAETVRFLQSLEDRERSVERLRTLGFREPDASYENLVLLRDGPPGAPARARRKKVLYEVAPSLLATVLKSPDPDLALQNVATFISSIGARTSFLALLRENPGTLRMLVNLFGGSQFLANAFIRHPELLDTLVRADLVRVRRSAGDLGADLHDLLSAETDFEGMLEILRHFRNQEFLRIGINDLQSLLEPQEVSQELTALAEVCLQAACDVAVRDVCQRYGCRQAPGDLTVLSLGKLGGRELNYNSDLDLIFIYREARGAPPKLSAHEFFSKLGQRLITVLQAITREGIVYRIDTRLRPSGRSGPLVSSLDGFRRYHETSARGWERQALIKARPVAGDAELGEKVAEIVSAFVYRAPLSAEEAREIRRLRGRMERELARESREHVNIKTGRGGLVDVEFLTQMLQLRYGSDEPRVRVRGTLQALDALLRVGVLGSDDHGVLVDGYRFLRRVENALRLAYDRPVEDLDRRRMDLRAVAKRLGFEGSSETAGEAMWNEYAVQRERIRACYERWFNRVEAGVNGTAPAAARRQPQKRGRRGEE